ncbi:hypothetical protein M011DRAFT_378436, partial [Sporormia fimetaria CBS 119925]
STPTIYFGFGSNLWLHQMSIRCPTSTYLGVARLNNYKWIINGRGYANVVSITNTNTSTGTTTPPSKEEPDYNTTVYGLVFSLLPADEARLDVNEGVPFAYQKEYLECEFWPSEGERWVDVGEEPEERREMLVYVDRERVEESSPREEYVLRMNRGIEDALRLGVPEGYVEGVMRRFIPEDGEKGEAGDGGLEEKARRQARGFRDESGVF